MTAHHKKISWSRQKKAEEYAKKHNITVRRACRLVAEDDPGGREIELPSRSYCQSLIKRRQVSSHKGSFGKCLIIAGSQRYPGAAQIATIAALRSGAGLVSVFTSLGCASALAISAKEATLMPCPADENGFILPGDREINELSQSCRGASSILIGCGLGISTGGMTALRTAIECSACPIIIDADGINLVFSGIELLRKARGRLILTPHPAELSRLLKSPLDEVLKNRYPLARELSRELDAVIAAKSSDTLIISPERACLTGFGNDGLSKGGSGDLQAGITASLLAQGYGAFEAALLGSAILGICCERVSRRLSKTGMLASDILDYLPKLFKSYE